MAPLAAFLQSLLVERLDDLSIGLCEALPAASFDDLFAAIGKLQCLQKLSLESRGSLWDDTTIDGSVLIPLFAIKSISECSFECLPIQLTHAQINQLAAAWPRLRLLELETLHATIPLEAVAGLTKNPFLRHVTLRVAPVPAEWTWTPPASPDAIGFPSPARSLVLGDCTVAPAAASRVAQFFAHYFPIAEITTSVSNDPTAVATFERVLQERGRIIPSAVSARLCLRLCTRDDGVSPAPAELMQKLRGEARGAPSGLERLLVEIERELVTILGSSQKEANI